MASKGAKRKKRTRENRSVEADFVFRIRSSIAATAVLSDPDCLLRGPNSWIFPRALSHEIP